MPTILRAHPPNPTPQIHFFDIPSLHPNLAIDLLNPTPHPPTFLSDFPHILTQPLLLHPLISNPFTITNNLLIPIFYFLNKTYFAPQKNFYVLNCL